MNYSSSHHLLKAKKQAKDNNARKENKPSKFCEPTVLKILLCFIIKQKLYVSLANHF